ncbi:hypothetical protein TM48_03961 [Mycobacterium shottsii]|uniref:Uncharacterized protein n=1 Tax=Mycobacterium shottsii TaxID=133549 RepID=A0A7I7LK63_9MYCO|nr:hypothetical protein [Mycobacterium shottsii]QYL29474.1 hypothetical protein TM48_03961 [Mycobacterium shottsii]BBX59773.1 hypothetical protein MSHO_51180 [Mycobacterium shottsii]
MPTTNDNTATTWRDLADQLSADERAAFEHLENLAMPTAVLLDRARLEIEGRLVDIACADIPVPADATWVGKWEKNLKRDGYSRLLVWRESREPSMAVDIDGDQQCDGTVTRYISAYLGDEPKFSSSQARKLAAMLVEAADALDAMGGAI